MIYFDNAASGGRKPEIVLSAVASAIKVCANPGRSGHKLSVAAADIVFKTRCNIAEMFGIAEPENIAFVPNATYGMNMLIMGCLKKGDHVVTMTMTRKWLRRHTAQVQVGLTLISSTDG